MRTLQVGERIRCWENGPVCTVEAVNLSSALIRWEVRKVEMGWDADVGGVVERVTLKNEFSRISPISLVEHL